MAVSHLALCQVVSSPNTALISLWAVVMNGDVSSSLTTCFLFEDTQEVFVFDTVGVMGVDNIFGGSIRRGDLVGDHVVEGPAQIPLRSLACVSTCYVCHQMDHCACLVSTSVAGIIHNGITMCYSSVR